MQKFVKYLENSSKDRICRAWTFGDWLSQDKLDSDWKPRKIEKSSDPKASEIFRPSGEVAERKSEHPLGGYTRKDLVATAYFARSTELLSKVAEALGKTMTPKVRWTRGRGEKAFVKKFVYEDGTVDNETQTAYLLALGFDLLPENIRQKSFDKFVEVLESSGVYLRTGFWGRRF